MAVDRNQTKKTKKFQNLTVDYKDLIGKMTINDRISMLRSDEGRQLMINNLSPYQLAEMFPDYYKKQYPDVGKLLKSISDPSFKSRITTREQADELMNRDVTRVGRGEKLASPTREVRPSWMKKFEQETGTKVSDSVAKAQLSQEKKQLLDDLKRGNISANDPRVEFLNRFSPEELKKFGIDVVGEGDKKEYKAAPIEVTQEEIDTARKATVTGKNNQEIVMKAMADQLRKEGVPQENIPYAVAALAGQVKQESGFNPKTSHDKGTGYGLYGARDEPKANGSKRRTEMFQWLDENGYDKDSAEGQAREMVVRAMSNKFPQSRRALMTANKDNTFDTAKVLTYEFENPQEKVKNTEDRHKHSQNLLPYAQNVATAVDIKADTPDEQIAEQLRKRKEGGQQASLAEALAPKLPPGASPKTAETFNSLTAKQKYDVIDGLKKSNKGIETLNEIVEKDPVSARTAMQKGKIAEPTATATPNAAAKGALLAAGTNDWADEEKAYQGIMRSATTLKESGRNVVLVAPAKMVNGQPHAYNAAQRAARDLGVKLVEPEEFGTGNDHYHISPNAAKKLREEYTDYDVYGDSNAVRLGAKEGVTARTGAGGAEISNIISSQIPAQPVTVNADGGQENINTDEIKAMPIKSLKGDNSVVVDKSNNPLFTMNTKEEQAVYNPKTRQVDVQPLSKTDPNQLGENKASPAETIEPALQDQQMPQTNLATQQSTLPSSEPRSGETSISMTDDLFKDPSFRRAIAKTRFVDTGDAALGGHFGMANADLG